MILNERPRCARTNTEMPVPTRLSKPAITVGVIERLARGKKGRRATKKVPAIAITLGKIPLAFLMGSSLMRNKIDTRPKKRMVDERDTASARNFHDTGPFPGA